MRDLIIAKIKKANPTILREVNRLAAGMALTKTLPPPLTLMQLRELIAQTNVVMLGASSGRGKSKKIIGFLTVYLVRIPTGLLAVAEDLLVDGPYRKWGVGRLLMEQAINLAEKKSARHISLRTNPIRTEANRLYQQMGFQLMTTNYFRINLPRKK